MNRLSRDPVALLKAAREGQRLALARLMSLVERGGDEARLLGAETYSHVGGGLYRWDDWRTWFGEI